MTANQISYQIGTSANAETERHNKATEVIQSQLAELEAQKLDFQNEWKKADQEIQKNYNDAYLNYLNADEAWKQHYQTLMAQLEQQKVDNDNYWKGIMAGIDKENADLRKRAQEETERANLASEELTNTQNWLKQKQIEYDATANLVANTLQENKIQTELLIAREQLEYQYTSKLAELQAEKAQQALTKERNWMQFTNDMLNNFNKTVQTASDLLLKFTLLGGNQHGKKKAE